MQVALPVRLVLARAGSRESTVCLLNVVRDASRASQGHSLAHFQRTVRDDNHGGLVKREMVERDMDKEKGRAGMPALANNLFLFWAYDLRFLCL
jgi:hypothetical protein